MLAEANRLHAIHQCGIAVSLGRQPLATKAKITIESQRASSKCPCGSLHQMLAAVMPVHTGGLMPPTNGDISAAGGVASSVPMVARASTVRARPMPDPHGGSASFARVQPPTRVA